MDVVLVTVVGYLLGSIPTADIAAWLATRGRVSPRRAGSGNPGAANVMQTVGKGWGIFVGLFDIGKGAAAAALGLAVGDGAAYLAGCAAVLGHVAPPWTRFRGGKGVATSAGVCLVLFPAGFPLFLAAAVIVALRARNAELATQVFLSLSVPAAAVWWAFDLPNAWGPDPGPGLVVACAACAAMVTTAFAVARVRSTSEAAPG